MNFLIADSFTNALAKLSGQEQKQTKTAAFDLQLNPAHPSFQMHRISNSRDPNFWSIRVNQDVRIIVHKTEASFMLAYVDHHDDAYNWAERRRIAAHPRTGAIQIVEVHEKIEEERPLLVDIDADRASQTLQPVAKAIFGDLSEESLLDIGTPPDWIEDILTWSEEHFFRMSDRLPAEVAEALLDYAATGILPKPDFQGLDPFDHPDTFRRVQTVATEEELRIALDFPWEKWSVFLHPSQREIVNRDYSGPARVTGSAGTGKTVVALHRAARTVHENPDARVLLTTFSRPLANALRPKLNILLGDNKAAIEHVSVASFEDAASELYQLATGKRPALASADVQQAAIERAITETGYSGLSARFISAEWRQIIDAWNISDLGSYAEVPRIGRRNRLGTKQREALWPVFEKAKEILAARGLMTSSQLCAAVEAEFRRKMHKPFTHVIVDEAQDLGVSELRMMGAISEGPNALFFAGDIGQRIFQLPFSWRSLGVDIRGRSSSLRINYRTSRQIREAADLLLPPKIRDVDGIEDDRTGAQSVFEGPAPTIDEFNDEADEIAKVSERLQEAIHKGVGASEIGIFVRAPEHLSRCRAAVAAAGLQCRQLSERTDELSDSIAIGTMHLAKGLEYKVVFVMACDDEALPLQSRVNEATDEDEMREVFDTERHLFYVACTRARDILYLSGVRPLSDFVADIMLNG